MTTGVRETGEFCWFNMLTPEPAKARASFGELLGWTFAETGMGHMAQAGGRGIGALFDLADPNTPEGTPPVIGLVVKVDSADDAGDRVRAAGGTARPAFDVGAAGRMSVCHDPNGAEFDLWEPREFPGTDAESTEPGAPTWYETMATDIDRAAEFYTAVFGWRAEPAGTRYQLLSNHRGPIAGARQSALEDSHPRWVTYFAVKDAERIVRNAIDLGATILAPATATSSGRVGGLCSPQGVPFHVMQRSEQGSPQ